VTGPDIGASIRARLLNKAKVEGQDFNLVLARYALERLLYRLGVSRPQSRQGPQAAALKSGRGRDPTHIPRPRWTCSAK
jgi:hypothetical protein